MLCLESRDKEGMSHCVFDVRMSENLTITQCFENKTKNLLSKQKQIFMSSQGCSRETRQTVKQRQAVWRSIKESMGDNEDPPAWAKELLTQVTSMKDTFQHKFDELSNSMKEIKKDTRAIVNRVGNAEKRIGSLEDKQVSQQLAIQDSAKEIKNLKAKVSYLESHSRRNNLIIVGLEEGLLEPVLLLKIQAKSWQRYSAIFSTGVRLTQRPRWTGTTGPSARALIQENHRGRTSCGC